MPKQFHKTKFMSDT